MPVIQARPVIVGTTAIWPSVSVVSSTSRPMNRVPMKDSFDEILPQRKLPSSVQLGHPGAGSGATRAAVEPAWVDRHRVAGVPGAGAGSDELDVVTAGDARIDPDAPAGRRH